MEDIHIRYSKINEKFLKDYCRSKYPKKTKEYRQERCWMILFNATWLSTTIFIVTMTHQHIEKRYGIGGLNQFIGSLKLAADIPSAICRLFFLFVIGMNLFLYIRLYIIMKDNFFPFHTSYKKERDIIRKMSGYSQYLVIQEFLKKIEIRKIEICNGSLIIEYIDEHNNDASIKLDKGANFNKTVKEDELDFTWIDKEIREQLLKRKEP